MTAIADRIDMPAAFRVDLSTIFVSLKLSKSTWLVTSLSPGSDKMSRQTIVGCDVHCLFACFAQLRAKAQERQGQLYPLVVIQEAGLDGFWIDRVLRRESWIASHVVDAASIAVPCRHRRAKTDRIDGEMLIRTLMAYMRGEPRVCSMVRVPTPEEEDRRRIGRERKALVAERILHVNRVKGLLFSQGIREYEPPHRDRRKRLEELRTGDGRELDRLELLLGQIKTVECERDAMTIPAAVGTQRPWQCCSALKVLVRNLQQSYTRKGCSVILTIEGRSPPMRGWRRHHGRADRSIVSRVSRRPENPRLRTTMVQLAWLWLRHQPDSMLARWFQDRVTRNGGRLKKAMIVALARKLLVALWKFVTAGVVIEGAAMKTA